ncbi:glycosyltransferase [Curtobacterium flaccumfaciens]|nr:glycosyltransferase [Curtobacterium flaccumfaciens]
MLQPHGALDEYHWRQGRTKKCWYSCIVDGLALRHVSRIVVSSTHEAADRTPRWARRLQSAEVTLGVDQTLLTLKRSAALAQSDPAILFLGRITQKKRLDLVLHALSTLREDGLRVRLIVAGPLDPQLTWSPADLARELGVTAAVSFLGPVDSDRRRDLLAAASVFVLSSDDESFGVSVAESLAAGCPAVVTETVGIASAAAAVGALRITAPTAAGLAKELTAVLTDPELSRRLSVLGRRYARSTFTWEHSGHQLADIYRDVLGK